MKPGDWHTLAGSEYSAPSSASTVIDVGDATMEAAATAILSIMPLDDDGEAPIAFRDANDNADDMPDVAFAVRGIAADAELRRVGMSSVTPDDFAALAKQSVLTVRAEKNGSPHAFMLRKGHC
jgi:L-fucose mutarotase